jgi:hypothetical protein
MPSIRVVHLVWAPLGTEPLERFVASYRRHTAGAAHRLLVVFKEFSSPQALAPAREALAGVDYEELHMPRRRLDLPAYGEVVREAVEDQLFFCNSNTEFLDDRWLAKLTGALELAGVGMASATGSWESGVSPAPLAMKPWRALRYRRFPSPHLRTNAFATFRGLAAELRWGPARTKGQAWALENGRRGLTNQVLARGLGVRVVGRDGVAYDIPGWAASRTFRSGEQQNLLVADNQTRAFANATPAQRRALGELAWGDAITS